MGRQQRPVHRGCSGRGELEVIELGLGVVVKVHVVEVVLDVVAGAAVRAPLLDLESPAEDVEDDDEDYPEQGDDDPDDLLQLEGVVPALHLGPVDQLVAVEPRAVAGADAVEAAVAVDAGAAVVAGVLVEALVDVDGAEGTRVAAALAGRAGQTLLAQAVVLAGVGVAVLAVVAALAWGKE